MRVVSSIRLAACLFAVPEGEIGRRLASINKDKENKTDASVGLQEFNMGFPLIAAQSAIHGHDLGHRDYAILGAGRRAAKSRATALYADGPIIGDLDLLDLRSKD